MKEFPAKEFEEFVGELMKKEKAPGLAVAVVSGGETVYSKGFGYRDEASRLPVTPNTMFGLASITKSFTALAIMQLVETGRLSLDDPVAKYLPGFGVPGGGEAISVHHFLTHTGGLPPLPLLGYSIRGNTKPDPDVDEEPAQATSKEIQPFRPINTYDQLMSYLRNGDFPLLGKPGEYCSYSNDAYALLGAIIESAGDETYEDYVVEHILRPLGMGRTTFNLDWMLGRADVTTLYYKNKDDEVKASANWQVAPPYLACGWLRSCAADMARYVAMYAGGGAFRGRKLVSSESVSKMAGLHHPYTRDRWYGYGLSSRPGYHGVTLVEHGGSLKGVNTNMGFVPEKGIGAVVLCNLSGGPASRAWLGAANLLLGLPVDTPRSEYRKDAWPQAELSCLAGLYKSGEGSEWVLTVAEGRLIATSAKKEYEVFKDSDDLGVLDVNGVDSEMRFYRLDGGEAWAIGFGGRIIRRAISE